MEVSYLFFFKKEVPRLWSNMSYDRSVCLQSCPTLCYAMYCSPPSSSVHGISQGRTLEWVAIPFSRGSFQPSVQTWQILYCLSHRRSLFFFFFFKKMSKRTDEFLKENSSCALKQKSNHWSVKDMQALTSTHLCGQKANFETEWNPNV